MATCREVIQSGYRRSGLLAFGVAMNAAQAQVGLDLLQGLYNNFIVGGMFGRATDYFYDSLTALEAAEGQRIFNKQGAVITLPAQVNDQAIGGGIRAPKDGAFIVVVNPAGLPESYLYDAGLAQWQSIPGLQLSDQAPLSGRFEDHIKNMVAVRLLGESGQPTPLELMRAEGRARMALAYRQDGERPSVKGVYS